MKYLIKNYDNLVKAFTEIKSKGFNKEYILLTEPLENKRSNQQLRAYWRLINVVWHYLKYDCGNEDYTKEQVSDSFLIDAGYCSNVRGREVAKSISNRAKMPREVMTRVIENIIQFGEENKIQDCFLLSSEWEEILRWRNAVNS
jgi:hypothetical protein